jgi:ATP-dependent Lon protease
MYTHDKNKRLAAYLRQKAIEPEADQQEADPFSDAVHKEPKYVRVFDTDKIEAFAEQNGRSSNSRITSKRLLSHLEDTNGYLPLIELPQTIIADLDELSNRFPNFLQVIGYYKQEFALAKLNDYPIFTAQPLLIAGPPGIGKTAFCHELAKLVNTHFEFISMSSITAGFILSGSSSKWAEGSYGKVVQSLAAGKCANPLLLLDEVDKAGGDKRYDPLGCLYSLLEKETAERFIDESLEIPINASHPVWIATANYLDRIPEPIVSRFTIIEVSPPSTNQMPKILNSVYKKILQKHHWGTLFQVELTEAVIDKLINTKVEPRFLQKLIIGACGRVVLRTTTNYDPTQKLEITVDDLILADLQDKPVTKPMPKKTLDQPDVVVIPVFSIPRLADDRNKEETIINWSVREIDHDGANKNHHLVGYIPSLQTGRVTSPIQEFDRKSMQLKTFSGRKYILEGSPGLSFEGDIAWEQWKQVNDIRQEIDVTHQYWIIH